MNIKKWLLLIGTLGTVIGTAVAVINMHPNSSSYNNSPIYTNSPSHTNSPIYINSNFSNLRYPTPTPTSKPTITPTPTSKTITTPYQYDITPYMDWNFVIDSPQQYNAWFNQIQAPYGSSYVKVTIHLNNTGSKPISTKFSFWNFVTDGIAYSYDKDLWNQANGGLSTEITDPVQPGYSGIFHITYLVPGSPTTGELVYTNPYTLT